MVLDRDLALNCGRAPSRHFLAPEVSEGAAVVFNTSIWLAFLRGLRGTCLASFDIRHRVLRNLDGAEALIEECFPENISC